MLGPLNSHTSRACSVAFSPTGDHLVSGSWDSTIRVWDVATGQCLPKMLQGHTQAIDSVAFSLDGKTLVSSSNDGTIRIWDWERFLSPVPVLDEDGWLVDEQERLLLWIPPDLRASLLWDEAQIDVLGHPFTTRLDLSKFRDDSWLSWDQNLK